MNLLKAALGKTRNSTAKRETVQVDDDQVLDDMIWEVTGHPEKKGTKIQLWEDLSDV